MSRRLGTRSIAIAASVAALLLLAGPAAAVPGWRGPITLVTRWSEITDVRVGVDAQGHVAIVGLDTHGLFALGNRSGAWQEVRFDAPPATDEVQDIAGVFDRAGHSYLVWSRGCGAHHDCAAAGIWMLTDRDGGPNHGWPLTPVRLAEGEFREPAFQAQGDRLHLAYVDAHIRVRYRTATDVNGPWTDRLVWGNSIGFGPALTLDADGRPNLVAWHDGELTWARAVGSAAAPTFVSRVVPGSMEFDQVPMLALDAEGDPTVAWTRTSYCGVDPCTPTGAEGAWVRTWNGSSWSRAKHVAAADALSLRMDPAGRPRLLTDRPSMLDRTASTWTKTVLLREPLAYRSMVQAGALALGIDGRAVVVVADQVRVDGHRRWALLLFRER